MYWVGPPNYTIYSLPLGSLSGAMPNTVASLTEAPLSIATDGTNVYFGTSSTTKGNIYYVPVGSSSTSATVVYTSPFEVSSELYVVAAAGALYWYDSSAASGSNIMGIATP